VPLAYTSQPPQEASSHHVAAALSEQAATPAALALSAPHPTAHTNLQTYHGYLGCIAQVYNRGHAYRQTKRANSNTTEQHAIRRTEHQHAAWPACKATSSLGMPRRQELRRGRTRDTAWQAAALWATQAQGRPAALIDPHGDCPADRPVRGSRSGRRRAAPSAHSRQRRHARRRAHPPEVPEVGAQRRPELPRSHKPSERAH